MASAPGNLRFSAHWTDGVIFGAGGGIITRTNPIPQNGVFLWDEVETGPCFYRVEALKAGTATWVFIADVPKGIAFTPLELSQVASDGSSGINIYGEVRVTCFAIPGDGSPGTTTLTTIHPSTFPHVAASSPDIVIKAATTPTEVGKYAYVTVKWTDASVWVAVITLKLYNLATGASPSGGNVVVVRPGPYYGAGRSPQITVRFPLTGTGSADPSAVSEGSSIGFFLRTWDLADLYTDTLSNGVDLITTFVFSFYAPVTITGVFLVATRDQFYAHDFKADPNHTGSPTLATYSATGLPAGMTVNSSGILSGTPTVAGSYTIRLTAVTPNGDAAVSNIPLTVNIPAVPVINGPTTPQAISTLIAYTTQLRATNNPSSFAIVSGTLPAGLSLNTTTGIINGTATTAGSSTVVFKATNSLGDSPNYTIVFNVTVLATPTITSTSSVTAYIGEAFNYPISSSPIANSYSVNGLPPGLTASGSVISGAVAIDANAGDIYQVVIIGTNIAGDGVPFTLNITIAARPPAVTSPSTATAIIGSLFTYQITATNNPTGFGVGSLPDGLSLNAATGLISGTPTRLGTFPFQISAQNSAGTGTETLTLTVALPPVPVIDTTIVAGKAITAKTGIHIVFQPSASNSPTNWRAGSNIPDALVLDAPTGALSGVFLSPGLYSIIFIATNSGGDSAPVTFYFLVEAGPAGAIAATSSSGVDIWIDVQDGTVAVTAPVDTTTSGTSTPPVGDKIVKAKRGDTLPITLRFHKSGRSVALVPSSLKLGVRGSYTDPYVILSAGFNPVTGFDGAFSLALDLSANPELEFEFGKDSSSIDFLAEVQWETSNPDTRRSSETFTLEVQRDIVNPD